MICSCTCRTTLECSTQKQKPGTNTSAHKSAEYFSLGGSLAARHRVASSAVHEAGMDFGSRRSPVLGRRGMVACTQPLAAEVTSEIAQGLTLPIRRVCEWCTLTRKARQTFKEVVSLLAGGHANPPAWWQRCRRGSCCGRCPERHRTLLHRLFRSRVSPWQLDWPSS